MTWRSRRPAPPLDAAIDAVWYFHSAPRPFALERVLPQGTAHLVVNLKDDVTRVYDAVDGACRTSSGSVLTGPSTQFEIIDTDEQEHVVGVSFRPGGTRPFFAMPAHELAGPDLPLDGLWPVADVRRLRSRLLEATSPAAALDILEGALLAAWRAQPLHRAVAAALASFRRAPHVARIGAMATHVGLSERRFIEVFSNDVGVTPKQYCRVRRFQQALTAAYSTADVDWADVAVSGGYYDQAHFIRDFRAFSGLTPTGYLAGRTTFQNHVSFLQSPGG